MSTCDVCGAYGRGRVIEWAYDPLGVSELRLCRDCNTLWILWYMAGERPGV